MVFPLAIGVLFGLLTLALLDPSPKSQPAPSPSAVRFQILGAGSPGFGPHEQHELDDEQTRVELNCYAPNLVCCDPY